MPEQVGTQEHDKMLQRIRILEDGRIPAKEASNWKIEGQKRRITRKEYRKMWNEFETGGFMAQKGLWNAARKKMLQDRGTLPEEEGDIARECKAMHEENFLNGWLREDVEGKGERRKDRVEKAREEEESRSGKRKVAREKEKTVGVERRCVDPFSSDVFAELGPMDDLGSLWDFWEDFLSDACGFS